MLDLPFRILLVIIILAGASIGFPHRIRADREGGHIDRKVDGAPILIPLAIFSLSCLLGMIAWLINPTWMDWSSRALPDTIRYFGVIPGVLGLLLLRWMFRHLGTNVTSTSMPREKATLVVSGPYRYVRHPMYSALLLLIPMLALITANWFIPVMAMGSLLVLIARIPREERNLIARFGDDYREYMKRTPRMVPGGSQFPVDSSQSENKEP